MYLESQVVAQSTELPTDLYKKVKSEYFDPIDELSEHFPFKYSNDEFTLIDSFLDQISEMEEEIQSAESLIKKEEENLKLEWKVTQANSKEEISGMVEFFHKLLKLVRVVKCSVEQEEEQIKAVCEELVELNSERDTLTKLQQMLSIINSIEKGESIDKHQPELVDIDCIHTSLSTLNFEEYSKIKSIISTELDRLKERTIYNYRTAVEKGDYITAKKNSHYLRNANEIDSLIKELTSIIFDEAQQYTISQKEEQISELSRTLLKLNRQMIEFSEGDGVFVKVSDEPFELLQMVCLHATRIYVCAPFRRLLQATVDSSQDTFLYYFDVFRTKYNEFQRKLSQNDTVIPILDRMNDQFKEIINDYIHIYSRIEKERFVNFLKIKMGLEKKKLLSLGDSLSDGKDPADEILPLIVDHLENEKIEMLILHTKGVLERCFRNSPSHKKAENAGDFLVLFMDNIFNHLADLLEVAETVIPNPTEKHPARERLLSIVGQSLFLNKRIELLFLEFKRSIINLFKLEEAEKIKSKGIAKVEYLSSKILNNSLGNIMATVSQIFLSSRNKGVKKTPLQTETSPICSLIVAFYKPYIKEIDSRMGPELRCKTLQILSNHLLEQLESGLTSQRMVVTDKALLRMDIQGYQSLFAKKGILKIDEGYSQMIKLVDVLGEGNTGLKMLKNDPELQKIGDAKVMMFAMIGKKKELNTFKQ